jgi:gluconolactonase
MRKIWCFGILLAVAAPAAAQDMPLSQVLVSGEGWQAAAVECKSAAALAGDGRGNVYIADLEGKQIWRLDKDGKESVFAKTEGAVRGLAAADGKLFAAEPDTRKVVVYDADGKQTAEYKDIAAQYFAVTKGGDIYCSVPKGKAVYLLDRDGKERKVAGDLLWPGALVLWTDGGTLVVADAGGRYLYAFRVQKNGDLDAREPYYQFRVRPDYPFWEPSDNAGLTLDAAGRAYATSREGVQVFDPTGRLSGIMVAPERKALGGVAFGGADLDRLYVVCGGKVYVRKVQSKGVKAQAAAP